MLAFIFHTKQARRRQPSCAFEVDDTVIFPIMPMKASNNISVLFSAIISREI